MCRFCVFENGVASNVGETKKKPTSPFHWHKIGLGLFVGNVTVRIKMDRGGTNGGGGQLCGRGGGDPDPVTVGGGSSVVHLRFGAKRRDGPREGPGHAPRSTSGVGCTIWITTVAVPLGPRGTGGVRRGPGATPSLPPPTPGMSGKRGKHPTHPKSRSPTGVHLYGGNGHNTDH